MRSSEVPVEVLPPLPSDVPGPSPKKPLAGLKTFYHPASGVAILGIDLLFFGPQVIFPFDVPILCVIAFLATFPCVYLAQLKWAQDNPRSAAAKAFLGAFLAGLPSSIAGTIFGAAVIALSGLPRHPMDMLKKLTSTKLK